MAAMASSLEQVRSLHSVGSASTCSYTAARKVPGGGEVRCRGEGRCRGEARCRSRGRRVERCTMVQSLSPFIHWH